MFFESFTSWLSTVVNTLATLKRAITEFLQAENVSVLPIAVTSSIGSGGTEWWLLLLAFCFTALGTATQCLQSLQATHQQSRAIPFMYYFFCFTLMVALIALLLSKFVPRQSNFRFILEQLALMSAIVAFCSAMTIPFPCWFNFIVWPILALFLLIAFLCWYILGGSTRHNTNNGNPV
ncbi:hypothetical protein Leryth_011825 [Lithospermum erythrorhizon]|nr:hypothetical protein Leryth_011825 [Lithospermum erythrorhizon]